MREHFVWRRASAIARKETFHILRDPFTLALALLMPIFMVVIYGLAIDFNVKNIALAVTDFDRTTASRSFIDTFGSSDYFKIKPTFSASEAMDQVASEEAKATLIIPSGFEKDLLSGRTASAQVLLDGADNSTVGPAIGYVNAIGLIAADRLVGFKSAQSVELRTRFLFNPELSSRWFIIPGLTVVVMAILSILLTALTVAREWENGSMELLLSTPVRPIEIIVGKIAPYGLLGLMAVTMVFIIARVFFQVPFVGNLLVFGAGAVIFLITYLAQGILISVHARNQQVALQFAMLTGFLPSQLLSGFIFPISSMPPFFQVLTMIFPARWFMNIGRDTFLKGSSIVALSASFFALSLICVLMGFRATTQFRRDLEK